MRVMGAPAYMLWVIGDEVVTIEFSGEVFYWRGPAPFYFVRTPPTQSQQLQDVMKLVTYGWGMIPVRVRVGHTEFTTALIPKTARICCPSRTRCARLRD